MLPQKTNEVFQSHCKQSSTDITVHHLDQHQGEPSSNEHKDHSTDNPILTPGFQGHEKNLEAASRRPLNEAELERLNTFSKQSENSKKSLSTPLNEIASDIGLEMSPEPKILSWIISSRLPYDRLVVNIKEIYVNLIMLENKCIAMNRACCREIQEGNHSRRTNLSHEEWRNLTLYHRTLIHQHYDFYLACQHSSACSELKDLINRHSMPARMWKHAIHSFVEILRFWLPETSDHLMAFVCDAYSLLILLSEIESTFVWTECLGTLARYFADIDRRSFITDNIWNDVARCWYSKTLDTYPNAGLLYYHLAKLARPYSLEQFSYYVTSSMCMIPFENAKKDIMALFGPSMIDQRPRSTSFVTVFIKAHGFLLYESFADEFEIVFHLIKERLLHDYIGSVTAAFKKHGVFVAITCIAGLFGYGSCIQSDSKSISRFGCEKVKANQLEQTKFRASRFAFSCLSVALLRVKDMNVLSLVHVYLVFLRSFTTIEKAMTTCIERDIPWTEICLFLNALIDSKSWGFRIFEKSFPDNYTNRPLPEDFIIRGQIYGQSYFPDDWFKDAMVDDEERMLESTMTTVARGERILWLGCNLACVRHAILCKITTRLNFCTSFIDGSISITICRLSRSYGKLDSIVSTLSRTKETFEKVETFY